MNYTPILLKTELYVHFNTEQSLRLPPEFLNRACNEFNITCLVVHSFCYHSTMERVIFMLKGATKTTMLLSFFVRKSFPGMNAKS